MKERPIIFSTKMVRAILDGRKTQTRRVVKFPLKLKSQEVKINTLNYSDADHPAILENCPYGQVWDELWVRETWGVGTRLDPLEGWVDGIEFRADEPYCDDAGLYPIPNTIDPELVSRNEGRGWRPSIYMPRLVSRITLKIINIRIEKLHDITDGDIAKEGVEWASTQIGNKYGSHAKDDFALLWDSINEKRGYSWESNPWVWVIEFNKKQTKE